MTLIEMKSATITSKGQISIPKKVRGLKGFKTGSRIAILAFKNRIELRPLTQVQKRLSTMLATERVLAKDWNSKEDEEAWKNL